MGPAPPLAINPLSSQQDFLLAKGLKGFLRQAAKFQKVRSAPGISFSLLFLSPLDNEILMGVKYSWIVCVGSFLIRLLKDEREAFDDGETFLPGFEDP